MIDTDKYEGHSIEYSYEIVSVDDDKDMDATYALLNDAPLLLEAYKQLREGIESYLLRYEPEELVREDGVIIHELKELIE